MGLREHAEREMRLAFTEECEMQDTVRENVMELINVFAEQGHSGFSAPYVLDLFEKVANYKLLSPLTGDDSEWFDVSQYFGSSRVVFQNNRLSSVFKEGDRAYDCDARSFYDSEMCGYTCSDSRLYITFPYTQKREYYISSEEYKKYLNKKDQTTGDKKT